MNTAFLVLTNAHEMQKFKNITKLVQHQLLKDPLTSTELETSQQKRKPDQGYYMKSILLLKIQTEKN